MRKIPMSRAGSRQPSAIVRVREALVLSGLTPLQADDLTMEFINQILRECGDAFRQEGIIP